MKNLALFDLNSINTIITPKYFEQLTINSNALEVLTDFNFQKAFVVSSEMVAEKALKSMLAAHVQMKIIVTEDDEFVGMISTNELSERFIVAEVAKGHSRDEVLVKDLMIPREDLFAFDFEDLKHSSVKDVVNALKTNHLRHCLVIDSDEKYIRGVISASDIARKLQVPIAINDKASFSKLFDIIHS